MALPSRNNPIKLQPDNSTEVTSTVENPKVPPRTTEEVKSLLAEATGQAADTLVDMLTKGDPQHRIAAAKALIAAAHGKDGLQAQEEKKDYAKDISTLLQQSRKPTTEALKEFEEQFKITHAHLTPHQFEAIHVFTKSFLMSSNVG